MREKVVKMLYNLALLMVFIPLINAFYLMNSDETTNIYQIVLLVILIYQIIVYRLIMYISNK